MTRIDGNVLVNASHLYNIADAIRSKSGDDSLLIPADMANAIRSITGGGGGTKNILKGTTQPTASEGEDGDIYLHYIPAPALPDGGSFVEYLESSGTQYIDTDIYITQDTDIYVRFAHMSTTDDGILGVRQGSWTSFQKSLYINDAPSVARLFKASSSASGNDSSGVTLTAGQVAEARTHTVRVGSVSVFTCEVNGYICRAMGNQADFTQTYPMRIFGYGGPSPTVCNKGNIQRLTVFEGGTLITDYLPAIDGDGVACMWDNVAREYVYNDGTGDFAYGGEITVDEPDQVVGAYLKVNGAWVALIGQDIDDVDTEGGEPADDPFALTEYIEGTGTQWINTGYSVSNDSRIELVAEHNSPNDTITLFGVRDSTSGGANDKACLIYMGGSSNSNRVYYQWGSVQASSPDNTSSRLRGMKAVHRLIRGRVNVYTQDWFAWANGFTASTTASTRPLYLLARNEAGTVADICPAKVYRFRIYEGETLALDLLPYEDNGEACLRDSLTGTIYRNAGTGEFTFGTDEG